MKRFLILMLTALLLCAPALAETVITVSGTGTVYVEADQAVITLGVTERDVDVQTAQSRVNTVIAAIRASLTAAGAA